MTKRGVVAAVPCNARDRAYEDLRRRIVMVELPPGAALSENEMAVALGVSRTPVREALLLLANEGLVRVFPKVGTFVSRVDAEQVSEAQFMREAVELAALESIRFPVSADALRALEANVAEQDRVGDDPARFFELDEAFHRGLMELGGHGRSWSFVAAAKAHLDRARMLGVTLLPILEPLRREHRAIYEAVRDGDGPRAAAALRAHLRTVFDDIQTIRAQRPELFLADPDSLPTRRSVAVWE